MLIGSYHDGDLRGLRNVAPRHDRGVWLNCTLLGRWANTPWIEALAGPAPWSHDLKLQGNIALMPSSRGIGLATAKACAVEGCCLVLSARSAEPLAAAEAALRADGVAVASCVADVGQPDQAARLVEAATAAFGGIDILVNNVGGGGARIADSTDEDWRGALERNLIQTVRMMQLALPHMQGRAGASVINVASISGWSPQLAMSGQYGAAKAALIFDAERWALECVPHGVRVNTVSPGSILVAGNGWDRYRIAKPDYMGKTLIERRADPNRLAEASA